MMTKSV